MGVLHAFVDGDKNKVAKVSGFFKGYTWAMEKNNTGFFLFIYFFNYYYFYNVYYYYYDYFSYYL
jgi:hypothetical protein